MEIKKKVLHNCLLFFFKKISGNTGIFIYGLMVTALVGQLVYKKPKKYGWYTCGKICNEHYKLRRHLMKVYIFIDYRNHKFYFDWPQLTLYTIMKKQNTDERFTLRSATVLYILNRTVKPAYSTVERHRVINHCDRHITLFSDTDISLGLFNLFTYFDVPFE